MTGWPAGHLVVRVQHEFHCQQTTWVENDAGYKNLRHFHFQESENKTDYHVEATGPMLPGLANPHSA